MSGTTWLELLHFGASVALAVLVAFVIRPVTKILDRVSAIEQRLSFIEGRLSRRRASDDVPRHGHADE